MSHWQPWEPEKAAILRFDNPFAEHAFPNDLLPANFTFSEVERSERHFGFGWTPTHP